jgi:hypothetical protein
MQNSLYRQARPLRPCSRNTLSMVAFSMLLLTLLTTFSFPMPLPQGMPPPALASPPPAVLRSSFAQTRNSIERLHQRTRAHMLAALTPPHRALLARIVGELAIARTPDPSAAASTLESALTHGEKQTILQAQNDELAAAQRIIRATLSANAEPRFFPLSTQPVHETHAGAALLRSCLLIGSYATQ